MYDKNQIVNICSANDIYLAYLFQKVLLKNYNYNEKAFIIQNDIFMYSVYEPKSNPDNICVVAHLDTVGYVDNSLIIMQDITNPHILYHNGGGYFDDRAGVLAILSLLNDGKRPYIIFTGQEENGCVGSIQLTEDYKTIDSLFSDNNSIQCLVQLDRHGDKEVVFYDLEYPEFEKIFTRYFDKNKGIYSDIAILCPLWNIAGANLSVGYYNEHTFKEKLDLNSLNYTIEHLEKIILSFKDYSKSDRWEYKGNQDTKNLLVSSYSSFMEELYPSQYFYDYSIQEDKKEEEVET